MSLAKDKLSLRTAAMSATAQLSDYIARLEGGARSGGLDAPAARRRVAARLGVSPGTLENIRKGRVKRLVPGLIERARDMVVAALLSELRALEHDVVVVRARALDADRDAVAEMVALAQRARALADEVRA